MGRVGGERQDLNLSHINPLLTPIKTIHTNTLLSNQSPLPIYETQAQISQRFRSTHGPIQPGQSTNSSISLPKVQNSQSVFLSNSQLKNGPVVTARSIDVSSVFSGAPLRGAFPKNLGGSD